MVDSGARNCKYGCRLCLMLRIEGHCLRHSYQEMLVQVLMMKVMYQVQLAISEVARVLRYSY